MEEDFEADMALLSDDPYKLVALSKRDGKPEANTSASQPSAADDADPASVQPAADVSPGTA